MNIIVPIIGALWVVLVCVMHSKNRKAIKKLESEKAASEAWSRALVTRNNWHKEHPYASLSHPEHQKLLRQELGAYMRWLEIHPETLDDESEYVKHATKLKELSSAIDEKISLV